MGRGGPARSAGGAQPPIRGQLVGVDAATSAGSERAFGIADAVRPGRDSVECDDGGADTGKIARSLCAGRNSTSDAIG